MFYGFSKIFWLFFQPLTIIFLLVAIGLLAAWRGFRRLGIAVLIPATALLFFGAFTTGGAMLLSPLENRFPKSESLPQHVDGIIVLGGYMNGEIVAGRQNFELNSAADRIVETMRLARLYPDAKILVSGGEGTFLKNRRGRRRRPARFCWILVFPAIATFLKANHAIRWKMRFSRRLWRSPSRAKHGFW